MLLRICSVGLALSLILAAHIGAKGQANTKTMKDDQGRCTASVPANITMIMPWVAKGPGDPLMVTISYDGNPYKVLSAAEISENHYSHALENSATRQILEKASNAPGAPAGQRVFHVYVPAPNGSCHLSISIKAPGNEATVKQIAATLAPVK